jgi:tRNA(fMet)-specific endonuclease VapC
MSLFVLDTDALSLYQHGHPTLKPRVQACPKQDRAITIITVEEQLSGWYTMVRQAKSRSTLAHAYQHLTESVGFMGGVRILSLTESAIERYEQLAGQRLNVKKNDLRIAAIALENNATVVTRNLRDFQRVPGLAVENWAV